MRGDFFAKKQAADNKQRTNENACTNKSKVKG